MAAIRASQTTPIRTTPSAEKLASKPTITNGMLTVTVAGKKVTLVQDKENPWSQGAVKAWTLDGGRLVAWSQRDGSGGFEGEGQSLRVYDVKTGKTTKVMSEYFMIEDVKTAKVGGKTALLVKMQDGGLGGLHFGLVDPTRGQVFRSPMATGTVSGKELVLNRYNENSFVQVETTGGQPKPIKTEKFDLAKLLAGKVIVNKLGW